MAKYSTSCRCTSRMPPGFVGVEPSMWYMRARRSFVDVLRSKHASPGPPASAATAVRNSGKAKKRTWR